MKAHLIILLLCCGTVFSGCSLLSAPITMMKQLLPLAVKYAPYALMFLEEPSETKLAEAHFPEGNFHLNWENEAKKEKNNFPELPLSLQKRLEEKGKKIKAVYILPLESPQDMEKFRSLYSDLSSQGHVHYTLTSYDHNNPQQAKEIQHILHQNSTMIYATLPNTRVVR